jgi:hypothetical protein
LDANELLFDTAGWHLAHGDVDGDGDQDLVGAQSGLYRPEIHVLVNDGAAHFELAHVISFPDEPQALRIFDLALGDIDADGFLDVVCGHFPAVVTVALGNGDGSFGAVTKFAGLVHGKVALGDLDGDGHVDILNGTTGGLEPGSKLLRGDGTGAFSGLSSIPGAPNATFAMGDLNGDGSLDLLPGGTTSAWLNDGAGSFSAGPAGQCLLDARLADLDADGDLDGVGFANPLFVCENDGTGKFAIVNLLDRGGAYADMALADFNRDGLLDAVAPGNPSGIGESSTNEERAVVLLNRGNLGFQAAAVPALGLDATSVTAADFDTDGNPDIVVGGYDYNVGGRLQILLGYGDGRFKSSSPIDGGGTGGFLVTDLNADGLLDTLSGGGVLTMHLGRGRYLEPSLYSAADRGSQSMQSADLDSDGDLDVVAGTSGSYITVYRRTGPTSFAAGVDYTADRGAKRVTTGDFDGDGDIDVAAACYGEYVNGFEILGAVTIHRNNGDGTFAAPAVLKAGYRHPSGIVAVRLSTAAARETLAIVDEGDGYLKLAAPTGTAGFQPPSVVGGIFAATAITSGDVNGDGKLDIAVVGGVADTQAGYAQSYDPGYASVYYGNGNGGLQSGPSHEVGIGPVSVSAGDLDGDGRDDLAVTNASDSSVTVLRPIAANGGFVGATYSVGTDMVDAKIADMDNDGKRDVVMLNSFSVYVVRNLSKPHTAAKSLPTTCGNATREDDEACDGADLGGKTCADVVGPGASGTLNCGGYCEWDLSGCNPSTPCGPSLQYQAGSPWPMSGRCPSHAGRSDVNGPQSAALRWSYATGARELGGPAIAADGTVLVGGTDRFAYGVGGASGALKFKVPLEGGSTNVPAIRSEGTVILGGDSGSVNYFNVANGALSLGSTMGGAITSIVFGPATYNATSMYGSGAATFRSGAGAVAVDGGVSTTPALGPDNTEYFGTLTGSLYAGFVIPYAGGGSGSATLGLRWKVNVDHPILSDMALSASGDVYLPVSDGSLRAWHASGRQAWIANLGPGIGAPAVAASGRIAVATAEHVWGINPDGTVAWKVAGAFAGSTPSIGKDGKIYIGVDGSSLAVLTAEGTLLFKVVPPGSAALSRRLAQPALGTNNTAYYVAGGTLYAVGP